jgi:hypothetical protein
MKTIHGNGRMAMDEEERDRVMMYVGCMVIGYNGGVKAALGGCK